MLCNMETITRVHVLFHLDSIILKFDGEGQQEFGHRSCVKVQR